MVLQPHFNWAAVADRMDDAIDEYWGENVTLQPWSEANEYAEGSFDPDRPAVDCFGVYMQGPVMGSPTAGGQFTTRLAAGTIGFSLKTIYVQAAELKDKDLVILRERGDRVFEISIVDEGDSGRSMLHLLRSKIQSNLALARAPTKKFAKPRNAMAGIQEAIKPKRGAREPKKVEFKRRPRT